MEGPSHEIVDNEAIKLMDQRYLDSLPPVIPVSSKNHRVSKVRDALLSKMEEIFEGQLHKTWDGFFNDFEEGRPDPMSILNDRIITVAQKCFDMEFKTNIRKDSDHYKVYFNSTLKASDVCAIQDYNSMGKWKQGLDPDNSGCYPDYEKFEFDWFSGATIEEKEEAGRVHVSIKGLIMREGSLAELPVERCKTLDNSDKNHESCCLFYCCGRKSAALCEADDCYCCISGELQPGLRRKPDCIPCAFCADICSC